LTRDASNVTSTAIAKGRGRAPLVDADSLQEGGAGRRRPTEDAMLRLGLRAINEHRVRFALTTFAVVLGVRFVVAAFVVTDAVRAAVQGLYADISSGVDVSVRARSNLASGTSVGQADRDRIPDTLLATVRGVDGVKGADGNVTGYAQLLDKHGEAVTTTGVQSGMEGGMQLTFNRLDDLLAIAGSPAERFRRVAGRFGDRVAEVPAEAWDNPAPCDSWTPQASSSTCSPACSPWTRCCAAAATTGPGSPSPTTPTPRPSCSRSPAATPDGLIIQVTSSRW
jgi:hypothetical protein